MEVTIHELTCLPSHQLRFSIRLTHRGQVLLTVSGFRVVRGDAPQVFPLQTISNRRVPITVAHFSIPGTNRILEVLRSVRDELPTEPGERYSGPKLILWSDENGQEGTTDTPEAGGN